MKIGITLLFLSVGSVLVAEEPQQPVPTYSDVSYGPHVRNVLDFWRADGVGRRPLLVYIHGGGWTGGDKRQGGPAIQTFLDKGISVAAIHYRLTPDNPLPAPVHDAARSIQFLRWKAAEWNIETNHIALTGVSAGACTSMWLLLHDDVADPQATDPVLRESSRVCAAAVSVGQTCLDPKTVEGWLGPNVLKHRMINMAVGRKTMDEVILDYDKYHAIYFEFSPINHVDSEDPPLLMSYEPEMTLPARDASHGIHHPLLGMKLKQKSDACGHECHLLIPGFSNSEEYTGLSEFLMAQLLLP